MNFQLTYPGHVMAILLSSCLLLSHKIIAETNTEQNKVNITSEGNDIAFRKRQRVENKLKYFKKLVYSSPRVKMVDQGDNLKAKELLEKIRSYYLKAEHKFNLGNLVEANQFINKGFNEIPKVFRLVKDTNSEKQEQLRKYKELSGRVESFYLAFTKVASEKGKVVKNMLNLVEIKQQINKAKVIAEEERYSDACKIMEVVVAQLEEGLSKARDKETLVYTLDFATPKDEYIYELKRNKSYTLIVTNLLEHYPPEKAMRIPLVRRLLDKNKQSIKHAESLVLSGDIEQAIKKVEKGSKYLVQALRMSGLAL